MNQRSSALGFIIKKCEKNGENESLKYRGEIFPFIVLHKKTPSVNTEGVRRIGAC